VSAVAPTPSRRSTDVQDSQNLPQLSHTTTSSHPVQPSLTFLTRITDIMFAARQAFFQGSRRCFSASARQVCIFPEVATVLLVGRLAALRDGHAIGTIAAQDADFLSCRTPRSPFSVPLVALVSHCPCCSSSTPGLASSPSTTSV
jgi:hypothetical protein